MATIEQVIRAVNSLWPSAKIDEDDPFWCEALRGLTDEQRDIGIRELTISDERYVPKPGMVRAMCRHNDGGKEKTYLDHPEFNRTHLACRHALNEFAPPDGTFPIDVDRIIRGGRKIKQRHIMSGKVDERTAASYANSAMYRECVKAFASLMGDGDG